MDRVNAGQHALNVLGKAWGVLGCGVSNALGQSRGDTRRKLQKQGTSPAAHAIDQSSANCDQFFTDTAPVASLTSKLRGQIASERGGFREECTAKRKVGRSTTGELCARRVAAGGSEAAAEGAFE